MKILLAVFASFAAIDTLFSRSLFVARFNISIVSAVDGIRLHMPWLTAPMIFVTYLGSDPVVFLLAIIFAVWCVDRGLKADALWLVLTVAAARVAGTAAKILVMSPRPHLIAPPPPLDAFSGFAFPSGHALMSAVAWGAVALFAIRHARTGSARNLTVVLYTALILSIGFSRIYLGAHWPNDVLGGYLYAGCILIAARMLQKKYADRTIAKG